MVIGETINKVEYKNLQNLSEDPIELGENF